MVTASEDSRASPGRKMLIGRDHSKGEIDMALFLQHIQPKMSEMGLRASKDQLEDAFRKQYKPGVKLEEILNDVILQHSSIAIAASDVLVNTESDLAKAMKLSEKEEEEQFQRACAASMNEQVQSYQCHLLALGRNWKRVAGKPVGVYNIGCSCWFSVILQLLYHIPEVRRTLFLAHLRRFPRQTASIGNRRRLEGSQRLLAGVRSQLARMQAGRAACVDPEESVAALDQSWPGQGLRRDQQDAMEMLGRVVTMLEEATTQHGVIPGIPPQPVLPVSETQTRRSMEELNLCDESSNVEKMEEGQSINEETDDSPSSLSALFEGKLCHIASSKTGKTEVKREEKTRFFFSIPVSFSDLHSAMDEHIFPVSPGKQCWIEEPAPLLTFSISRYNYDCETAKNTIKLNNKFTFPEKLFIDRYMHAMRSEVLPKRLDLFDLKRQLKQELADVNSIEKVIVNAHASASVVEVLQAAKQILLAAPPNREGSASSKDEEPATKWNPPLPRDKIRSGRDQCINYLHSAITEISARKRELDEACEMTRAMISSLFDDRRSISYSLFAVIVHRGVSATSGHYTIFIRSRISESGWVLLNDGAASHATWELLKSRAFGEDHEVGENAYGLVYTLDDKESDLFDYENQLAHHSLDHLDSLPNDLREIVRKENEALVQAFEEAVKEGPAIEQTAAAGPSTLNESANGMQQSSEGDGAEKSGLDEEAARHPMKRKAETTPSAAMSAECVMKVVCDSEGEAREIVAGDALLSTHIGTRRLTCSDPASSRRSMQRRLSSGCSTPTERRPLHADPLPPPLEPLLPPLDPLPPPFPFLPSIHSALPVIHHPPGLSVPSSLQLHEDVQPPAPLPEFLTAQSPRESSPSEMQWISAEYLAQCKNVKLLVDVDESVFPQAEQWQMLYFSDLTSDLFNSPAFSHEHSRFHNEVVSSVNFLKKYWLDCNQDSIISANVKENFEVIVRPAVHHVSEEQEVTGSPFIYTVLVTVLEFLAVVLEEAGSEEGRMNVDRLSRQCSLSCYARTKRPLSGAAIGAFILRTLRHFSLDGRLRQAVEKTLECRQKSLLLEMEELEAYVDYEILLRFAFHLDAAISFLSKSHRHPQWGADARVCIESWTESDVRGMKDSASFAHHSILAFFCFQALETKPRLLRLHCASENDVISLLCLSLITTFRVLGKAATSTGPRTPALVDLNKKAELMAQIFMGGDRMKCDLACFVRERLARHLMAQRRMPSDSSAANRLAGLASLLNEPRQFCSGLPVSSDSLPPLPFSRPSARAALASHDVTFLPWHNADVQNFLTQCLPSN